MRYMAGKSAGAKLAMKCAEVKGLLSSYLDGAVTGTEMQAVREHMDRCAACIEEYQLLRRTQQLLLSVGRVQEPADLLLGDKLIARGEVVIVDSNYGLRITEVCDAQHHAAKGALSAAQ